MTLLRLLAIAAVMTLLVRTETSVDESCYDSGDALLPVQPHSVLWEGLT